MSGRQTEHSSVVSPIAETTTTRSWPAATTTRGNTRRATRLMPNPACATDEPPYFSTMGAGVAARLPPHSQHPARHGRGLRWRAAVRSARCPPCASSTTATRRSRPIAGGALRGPLTAADGNTSMARAATPGGAAVLLLQHRGLHPFYEELALRFAEHRNIDALAAGFPRARRPSRRGVRPHAARVGDDLGRDRRRHRRRRRQLRSARGSAPGQRPEVFTLGFCMGGRMSVPGRHFGARPRGRHRVLRHARRPVAQRCAGAGGRGRVDSASPVLRLLAAPSTEITRRPSPPSIRGSRRRAPPIAW